MAGAEATMIEGLRRRAGVTDQVDRFEIVQEGVRIDVACSGGSSSSVIFRVPYDEAARAAAAGYRGAAPLAVVRPMRIELGLETATHRTAKEEGLDVEHQTGDAAFDDAVYIDTPTPSDVLARVLDGAARRAVLDLFAAEFNAVTIDSDERNLMAVRVSFASSASGAPSEAERALDAFARLARALPPVIAKAGEHEAHPLEGPAKSVRALACLALFVAIPFYFGVSARRYCPEGDLAPSEVVGCFGPGLAGLVAGILAAVVVGAFATRHTHRYRGRSDSSRHGGAFAGWSAALALTVVGSIVAFVVGSYSR
jgi:hypothetical protein